MRSFKDDYLRGLGKPGNNISTPIAQYVEQIGHGFSLLDVVRYNASTDVWTEAQADATANVGKWIVVEVTDTDNFVIAMAGMYTIEAHGLTNSTQYYLSDSVAGGLTSTIPSANYNVPLVYAIDEDRIMITPYRTDPSASTFGFSGTIATGFSGTVPVALSSMFGFTIDGIRCVRGTGSIDVSVRINGVDVTGLSTISITGSIVYTAATGNNIVDPGDLVELVFTNNNSCQDISWMLQCTR